MGNSSNVRRVISLNHESSLFVIIPSRLVSELHLKRGDYLQFSLAGERLVLTKVPTAGVEE